MSEKRELQRGDVVKLGPTAQELHDVLHLVAQIGVRIRQRSTGKERTVDRDRCIVVRAADVGGMPKSTPYASRSTPWWAEADHEVQRQRSTES